MGKYNRPIDFKEDLKINDDPKHTRLDYLTAMEERLVMLYDTLEGWPEFGPDNHIMVYNIQKKLLIYNQIYELIGDISGECERFALWCDAKKKNVRDQYLLEHANDPGTVKMKELRADTMGKKYRLNRDYFRGLAKFWDNRRESTREAINVLKWLIRDAHEQIKGN